MIKANKQNHKSCYAMKFYDLQVNGTKELYNQIEFWIAGKNLKLMKLF